MRILVDHSGYHLRNLGDVAMLQGAVKRIRSSFPQSRIKVITSDPAQLRFFLPEVESLDHVQPHALESLRLLPVPHRPLPGALRRRALEWERVLRILRPDWVLRNVRAAGSPGRAWLDALSDCDAFIATGGGYLTDVFKDHAFRVLEHASLAQALFKPTAFFGQGIGPLESRTLRRCVRHVLRRADVIGLREPILGPKILDAMGIHHHSFTGDDALELINSDRPGAERAAEAIGINIRVSQYSGINPQMIPELRETLLRLAKEHDLPFRPIPIDFVGTPNDEEAALSVIPPGLLDPRYRRPDTPDEVISLVSTCRYLITGSYHAALFALAQGVPVAGIEASTYYAGKFDGLEAIFQSGVRRLHPLTFEPAASMRKASLTAEVVQREQRSQWCRCSRSLKKCGSELLGQALSELKV